MATFREREITEPVDLCLPDGSLNPAAVGWSRRPLHRTSLPRGLGAWGRNKRWEYWGIVTPTHVIGLTVSSLDYAGVHQVWVLDRAHGREIDETAVVPLARDVVLPDSFGASPARARAARLSITIDPHDTAIDLGARTSRVDLALRVERPPDHDCLAVVVPWSARRFQYTVKAPALPVSGRLTIDGQDIDVPAGTSWAVLDHGRGRWPYAITWNWGAGSGRVDGRVIGLQLGGKWTDRTGSTENALFIAGRAHKIGEDLTWHHDRTDWRAPWQVSGERLDLRFTPFYERKARTNLVLLYNDTHQCFGHWTGWVTDDTGQKVHVDGLIGWAEEVQNRW